MPLLPVLLLLAALSPRSFPEERQLLDRRLEALRRVLPDGPQPQNDAAHVTALAVAAGLRDLRIVARAPLETGAHGTVQVDVAGTTDFAGVDRFFRQVGSSPRLVDVEELTMRWGGRSDLVTFTSVLALPYRPAAARPRPGPDGPRPSFEGVPRAQSEAFVRDQALALDKTLRVVEARRAQRSPRLLLSEMSAAFRGRAAVLVEAVVKDEFFLRGLGLGDSTMEGLETRLERGFLRVADVIQMDAGACRRFEVRGTSPLVGPEADVAAAAMSPFGDADALCRLDRDRPRRAAIRGPKRKARAPRGPIVAYARDIDAADAFQVLATAGVGEFVVDADVVGRLDIDLAGVTRDEAIDAIRRAEFALETLGPLIRVRRSGNDRGALPAPPANGSDIRFAAKRAPLRELLAAIAELQSDLTVPASVPAARVSLWTAGTAPAAVREVLLALAGATAGDARASAPGTDAEERPTRLGPEDLTPAEFQLAALAQGPAGWTAFAYGPDGTLHPYRAGDGLARATIGSVESTDVVVQSEEGSIRFFLRP